MEQDAGAVNVVVNGPLLMKRYPEREVAVGIASGYKQCEKTTFEKLAGWRIEGLKYE